MSSHDKFEGNEMPPVGGFEKPDSKDYGNDDGDDLTSKDDDDYV